MIDQVGGNLHHALGITGLAGAACLARQGDQVVVNAVFATCPRKTSGGDPVVQLDRLGFPLSILIARI